MLRVTGQSATIADSVMVCSIEALMWMECGRDVTGMKKWCNAPRSPHDQHKRPVYASCYTVTINFTDWWMIVCSLPSTLPWPADVFRWAFTLQTHCIHKWFISTYERGHCQFWKKKSELHCSHRMKKYLMHFLKKVQKNKSELTCSVTKNVPHKTHTIWDYSVHVTNNFDVPHGLCPQSCFKAFYNPLSSLFFFVLHNQQGLSLTWQKYVYIYIDI